MINTRRACTRAGAPGAPLLCLAYRHPGMHDVAHRLLVTIGSYLNSRTHVESQCWALFDKPQVLKIGNLPRISYYKLVALCSNVFVYSAESFGLNGFQPESASTTPKNEKTAR